MSRQDDSGSKAARGLKVECNSKADGIMFHMRLKTQLTDCEQHLESLFLAFFFEQRDRLNEN